MKKIISLIIVLSSVLVLEAQSLKKLGLIFDQTTYHFGDVEQWNNQAAVFTFTNKSKLSLTILPLFSENDLDVVIPDKPILPGETIIIKAMYYTDGKGPFNRSFPIYFGSRAEPITLRITGNIKSLSPHAYIQCPMAKPEMSKPRIELIGDVAEIDTEIPLSGTTLEIIGLQTKKEVTLFSNSRGHFGAKLPVGNYMVIVKHPNYIPYKGTIYIGQTSPPLRIRLSPLNEAPLFVQNPKENLPQRAKEKTEYIASKNNELKTTNNEKDYDKVEMKTLLFPEEIKTKDIKEAPNQSNKPERDIDYVKHEPIDNPFSAEPTREEQREEIPQTLTTYKTTGKKEPETVYAQEKEAIAKQKNTATKPLDQKEPIAENNTSYKEPKPEPEERKLVYKEEVLANMDDLVKEKEKKAKPEKVVAPSIPKNQYVLRVINKNTLEPIEDASIFLSDLYNKRNKHSEKTDVKGYTELEAEKSDYRFIATADGYISNEIKILEDDKSEVFKIFLSPISDLYNEIYEAKKDRAKENEELLSKLSFGKTEFSFAKDDAEKVPERETFASHTTKEETPEKVDLKTYTPQTAAEPVVIEKVVYNTEKEDSLKREIKKLEALKAKDEQLKNELAEREAERTALRKQEEIDSLNQYIADLLVNNDQIESKLDEIAEDKQKLEAQRLRDKEKLEELTAENNQLQEPEDDDPFSPKKYLANNIMFLIDVSTSMEKGNKMEMLKTSIKNLAGILRPIDRVAIIAYNQKTNIVLESISGKNTTEILNAIDSLKTGGLTNGVKGLTTAYEMLEYYFIPEGNNQIILATDGLFSKYNNEMTENELNRLVKKQADKNMKLTVVGFGKDEDGKDLMEKLARNGTGQYIQIYNDYMTRDVLIKEIKLNSEIKVEVGSGK